MASLKILFIGGTGNISTDCAAYLHGRGHEIMILSRGRNVVPAEYRAIKADHKDASAMHDALKAARPDVVINFIGYELPDVQADYDLFKGEVRQYIFISSAVVYTRPAARLPLREDSPLGNSCWDYAQKKLACEEWLQQRYKQDGFPVTIVRPSHTYSQKWIPNAISSGSYTFAARLEQGMPVFLHDNGDSLWTLTATSDFAVGLGGLVGKAEAIGEVFHITSDEVLTWNQIYAEIAAALGVNDPRIVKVPTDFICKISPEMTGTLKGDKAYPGVFDTTKIKRFVPEFQCRKPFRVGVRESVNWLRKHPEQQNRKPELDTMIEKVIAAWSQHEA